MEIGKITGTFIDEITWDIGSQNWSADDWKRDFEAMSYIGIDMVIIIHGGLRDRAVFPSGVIGNLDDPDLAQLFLDEAAKHNMKLFFGSYDTGLPFFDDLSLIDNELSVNYRFFDEVLSRYGGHPALYGWYIAYEVCSNRDGISRVFKELSTHLKEKRPDFPTLISPFYPGKVLGAPHSMSPSQFSESWREILNGLDGLIDIMAFQDGPAATDEYEDFLVAAKALGEEFGIDLWNNVETFDRGLSYKFPPRDINVLRRRLAISEPYVKKHITFEFSHFMSPNSCFPGAANLYRRYCETVLKKESPF